MTTLRLKDIERFRIRDARTGQTWMGHDQEWFGTPWQRLAGCGPTTACNLFRYLAPALPASARRSRAFSRAMKAAVASTSGVSPGFSTPPRT